MAEIAAAARACQALLLNDMRERGRVTAMEDGRVDVNGLLREFRQFLQVERSALDSFGLVRVSRPVTSLNDVVATIAARKQEPTP